MKRIWIAALTVSVFFAACKNSDKKSDTAFSAETMKVKADSLYNQVLNEHEDGMRGWMKIEGRQKQIKKLLDSIASLPSKTQSSLRSLKAKLVDAGNDLANAYKEMDTWMQKMNLDSAANNVTVRIQYLSNEKLKGSKIKEMIDNSLQQADSLIKRKF